jgi:hypothetical protein
MRTFEVSLPEVAFVAATRGLAGAGIGLLAAECFRTSERRRAVGWTLLAIGALTTVPIAMTLVSRRAAVPALAGERTQRLPTSESETSYRTGSASRSY